MVGGDSHRLVLAVLNGRARAWVDGRPLGSGTVADSAAGDVAVELSNPAHGAPATFDLMRLVVYAPR